MSELALSICAKGGQSRHQRITLHCLLEALDADGCAICQLIERDNHTKMLFCEGSVDPRVRSSLLESCRSCQIHGWLAVDVPLAKTKSPSDDLIRLLLRRIAEFTHALQKRNKRPMLSRILNDSALLSLSPADVPCPICVSNHSTAGNCISELLHFFDDSEFRKRFHLSFGMCLPHLQIAVEEFSGNPSLAALLEVKQAKLAVLQAGLKEFERNRVYRLADESCGGEQASWRRVVEKFIGRRNITVPGPPHDYSKREGTA